MGLISIDDYLKNISFINEKIDVFLCEADKTYPAKTITYIVLEDETDIPGDNKNYIYLKDAIEVKPDVKVGDEIDIETVTWSDIYEDVKESQSGKGPLSKEHLAGLATFTTNPRTRRGAKMVGKYAIVGVPRAAGCTLNPIKCIKKKFAKVSHSICWCARLFDEFGDPTNNNEPSEANYKDDIKAYTNIVQDEMIKNWKKCDKQYMKKLKKERRRHKIIKECGDAESWAESMQDTLGKIISSLGEFFVIKGYEKNKDKTGGGSSIGEKIASHRKIRISFSTPDAATKIDLEKPDGTHIQTFKGGDQDFKVTGVHKAGGDSNTAVLTKSGRAYVFSFRSAKKGDPQSGKVYYKDGGDLGNPTVWDGKIVDFD